MMGLLSGIKSKVKTRIREEVDHKMKVKAAYREARRDADIKEVRKKARRDSKSKFSGSKSGSMGEKMMKAFGPTGVKGGGVSSFSSDMDKLLSRDPLSSGKRTKKRKQRKGKIKKVVYYN